MEELVAKTVYVYVVGINPKIKKKYIKLSKLQIIEILDFSKTFQHSFLCENAHAKSLNVKRNIVNVLVQV